MSARRAHDDARRDGHPALALLQRIAVVANEAASVGEAIQAALDGGGRRATDEGVVMPRVLVLDDDVVENAIRAATG